MNPLKIKKITVLLDQNHTWLSKLLSRAGYRYGNPCQNLLENLNIFKNRDFCESMKLQSNLIPEIRNILKGKKFKFYGSEWFSNSELNELVNQRVIERYSHPYFFHRIVRKIIGVEKIRPVWSCPSELRKLYETIDGKTFSCISTILWWNLASHIYLESMLKNLKMLVKLFIIKSASTRSTDVPDAYWFGFSLSELNLNSSKKDLSILHFIQDESISCLKNSKFIFIQTKTKNPILIQKSEKSVLIAKDCTQFIDKTQINRIDRISGTLGILMNFIWFTKAYFCMEWWNLLLLQEVSALLIFRFWIRSAKPKHILFSSLPGLVPIWTKMDLFQRNGLLSWGIFYSTNNQVLEYERELQNAEFPVYHIMLNDRFAVWNDFQKKWLNSLGYSNDKIEICGPIVFGKTNFKKHNKSEKGRQLFIFSIFDVIPYSEMFRLSIGSGELYYSFAYVQKFYEDILLSLQTQCREVDFKIWIKSKRSPLKLHNNAYWEYLKIFSKKAHPHANFFKPEFNPIEIIANSDAVISFPFTSTSFIAEKFQIPNSFYDPSGKLFNKVKGKSTPDFLNCEAALDLWIKKIIT